MGKLQGSSWKSWTVAEVGEWLGSQGHLAKFESNFVEARISGLMLPDVTEGALEEFVGIKTTFSRTQLMNAIAKLMLASTNEAEQQRAETANGPVAGVVTETGTLVLPPDKMYHYFGSHKKEHSKYSTDSESLAMRIKDTLEDVYGLKGFFDIDDLKQINESAIDAAIRQSCCVLVVLDDESLESRWCVREWQEAHASAIPIICTVNTDKFLVRPLITQYVTAGFDFLFSLQVISFCAAHRKACFQMISETIHDAVARRAIPEQQQTSRQTPHTPTENFGNEAIEAQLRRLVQENYQNTREFFDAIKNKQREEISRSGFKRGLEKLGLVVSENQRKTLRRKISSEGSKVITFEDLHLFVDGNEKESSGEENADATQEPMKKEGGMYLIPAELPPLLAAYHSRGAAEEALIAALRHTTNTKVAAQGMGGSGKTTLVTAAVRNPAVRKQYERLAFCVVSNQVDILSAMSRLHLQLAEKELPAAAAGNITLSYASLQKCSEGRNFLVVLDDVWSASVSKSLYFLDSNTRSTLLVSTRVRGLLDGATEVQLGILLLEEAISLLITLAEIPVDSTSEYSEMCHVCHLVGRLPLTISICAGMIKRFGSKWRSIIPLLQEDAFGMLNDEVETLGPSERVVERSFNSLDDEDTKTLFTLLGSAPEDEPVPIEVAVIFWTSQASVELEKRRTKRRIAIKVTKMADNLLRYNLILGNLDQDGFYFHDLVRDFSKRLCTDGEAMQQTIVSSFFASKPQNGWRAKDRSVERETRRYVSRGISHHISEALPTAKLEILTSDSAAVGWLTTLNPTEMLTDWIARKICTHLRPPLLLRLAESLEQQAKYAQAARLFACAALAGWDRDFLPVTITHYFLKAAGVLQNHFSDRASRTFECSLRLLSGLQLQHESDHADVCKTNLQRIKWIRDEGVDTVVKPNEVRLAQFETTTDSTETLETQISTLERQLANVDSAAPSPALLNCQCGKVQIQLLNPRPRARYECCCCDCNGIFKWAETQGGPTPGHPAVDFVYFENSLVVAKGPDQIAFYQLNKNYPSTRMVAKCCWTVLCMDHGVYAGRCIGVYNAFGNLKNVRDMPPQAVRLFYEDLPEAQLRSLRRQKPDSDFPLGSIGNLKNMFRRAKTDEAYSTWNFSKREHPVRAVGGRKFEDIASEKGITTLNWKPINRNKYHPYYEDPELGEKSFRWFREMRAALDQKEENVQEEDDDKGSLVRTFDVDS